MFKYIIILLSVFLLFLVPDSSFSWFSQSENTKVPCFTMNFSKSDISSNIYVLHYNTSEDCENSGISLDWGNNTGLFAGRINIDIPFGILSKEAIDPEESFDRLLAANLRIQNLRDEYLAFRKRANMLLKDLRIPYLEKSIKTKSPEIAIAGKVQEGEKLQKEIENIVRHGPGYNINNSEQDGQSIASINQPAQAGSGGNAFQQQGNENASFQGQLSTGYQKLPGENIGTSHDSELPWIFRPVLKVFAYVSNNKQELLLWSSLLVLSVLLVILVVKR